MERRTFCLYSQPCARLNPTIVNPGCFWVQPGFIVCLYQFASEGGTCFAALLFHRLKVQYLEYRASFMPQALNQIMISAESAAASVHRC